MTVAFIWLGNKPVPKGTSSLYITMTCRCFLQPGHVTSFTPPGRHTCRKGFDGINNSFAQTGQSILVTSIIPAGGGEFIKICSEEAS